MARRRARRHPHADLHVRHHRPAQGRAAHAPQPAGRRAARSRDHRVPGGRQVISWLPAAHIAERAAHHYIPIVFGDDDHDLPEPARDRRVTCPRCARPGSSPSRASGRSSRPACEAFLPRGEQPSATARGSPRQPEGRARAGRRAGARRARRRRSPRPTRQLFAGLRAMLGLDRADRGQRRRRADAAPRCSSSSTPSASRWPSCGACRRPAASAPATRPSGSRSARSARPRPGSRSSSPTTARCSSAATIVMTGYRNQPEQDRRGDRRRRLAAHRRHRRDRRRRLPHDRRPQEGDHHQRGRQEHVAGQHRVGAQGRQPADRPGLRDRRRAALQHGADRARRRLRARVGGAARPRGRILEALAGEPAMRAAVQAGVDAANEHLARVEQIKKFTIVARRLAARRRRADADDEAQAQADRGEVRGGDRGDVHMRCPRRA